MSEVVVLRGEYFVNHHPDITICSPNAKNGEILLSNGTGFAAMIHIDNEENLKEVGKILTKLRKFDPNFKCTVMGRDSDQLRGHITDLLEKFQPGELNQETWSGSHPYNVSLGFDGTISVNNSVEISRKFMHHMLFSDDGEERLSQAVSGKVVDKLREITLPKREVKKAQVTQLHDGVRQH